MKSIKRIIWGCFVTLFSITLSANEHPPILEWSEYPPLPDSKGYSGSFIGAHNGVIILAGGENISHPSVSDETSKQWSSDIYVLRTNASDQYQWFKETISLTQPLAHGASIETDRGLICIGGKNSNGTQDEVFRLSWDNKTQQIIKEDLPDLPMLLAAMGGAQVGNTIFLVGGEEVANGKASNHFMALDLSKELLDDLKWETLTPFPGAERADPVVVAQNNGQVDALYVFGGRNVAAGSNHSPNWLSDVYMYNPKALQWVRKNDMPPGQIGGAPVLAHGGSHVLVFGTAADLNWPLESQSGLDGKIRVYHTITDTWVEAGSMPGPVSMGSKAVFLNGSVVIPGGATGPGGKASRVFTGAFIDKPANFGTINYITLIGYLCLIVWMGWYFSKRTQNTDDFFLGGRRVPWWAAGLSIYATMLSAITYISQPALAFSFDWQVYLGYFAILLMAPLVIAFYLPYYRKLNIITAYQYLEQRFDLATRMFGSISFVLFQLARMGIVVYLPALALSTAIGMDIFVAIILMGVLAIVYTVMGGMEAVIWTDVLQVIVLFLGLIFGLIYSLMEVGSFEHILEVAYQDNKFQMFDWRWSTTEVVTWSLFIGTFALTIAPYTADQAVVQRYMTTPTEEEARKSIWVNGLITIPAGLLILGMGTFMYVYFKEHPELLLIGMENDRIFPLFIANQLPAGVAGLVIAGIFSASMSSLDSSMHSVSTVISIDFYQRFKPSYTDNSSLSIARWTTVVIGVLGTAIACLIAAYPVASLFFLFQEVLGVFGSALAGVFILGVFTKTTDGRGALIGALLSITVVFLVKYLTSINFYIYPIIGIPICVVVGYITSKIWPNNR